MEHLFNRFSLYHLFDYLIPGIIISFEGYHILPSSMKMLFNGNIWFIGIIFIVFSFIFGILNSCISFKLIHFYADGLMSSLSKSILSVIHSILGSISNKMEENRKKRLEEDDDEDTFEINEDYINELKTRTIIQDNEKHVELEDFSEEELLNFIKENYIPDQLLEFDDLQLLEYIYLYLQGKPIKNRLADFVTQRNLNRNLCSFCFISAFLMIFIRFNAFFLLRILYKFIGFVLFLLVGNVFYQEYIITEKKVNKYILLWFVQSQESKD